MGFRQLISKAGDIAQQVNQEYQRTRQAQQQSQPQPQQSQQQQYGQPSQYGQRQPHQQQYGQSSQYGQSGQNSQPQQNDQARYQPPSPAWSPPATTQESGQPRHETNHIQYQSTYTQPEYQYTQDTADQHFVAAKAQLAAEQAEAARLATQYNAELNQLSKNADAELARLRREQHDASILAARELERLQREQQEALREKERLDAQLAEDQREAERLQRVYQQEYEREVRAGQVEGERLRREGEEQVRRFEALKIQEDAPPPMPPRPVSQVYYPPPPPPRPTSWVPPPSVQVSPPAMEGQQNAYYPPPPRSPQLPPRPTSSVHSGYTPPSVQVSPPTTRDVHYPAPPPSPGVKTGPTSTGEVYRQPSPQAAAPTFDPPPKQAPNSPYQQPSPRPSPAFAPPPTQPQPSSYQPSPPQLQTYTESPSIPRQRTPPPQKPHPCGITPLTECIEDPVSFSVDWFHHAAAPDFPICSKCYVDKIYATQFKDAFKLARYTEKKPRKCLFGTKRMQDIFWPAAISSGSLSNVVEFMQKRQNIKNCPENNPTEGEGWYMTPDIPNSTFCQACYEDGLMASSFAARFHLETPQGASFCDSSAAYVKRMFEAHAPMNNWPAFIQGVKLRINCLPCTKRDVVKATERVWYSSTRKPLDLEICQACYYDFIYGTADEHIFRERAPKEEKATCLLAILSLHVPANVAIGKRDRSIFWTGINGVDDNVYCSPNGTKGASWYTFPNDPVGFGICGGCYAGVVQVMGGTGYFVRKSVSPTDELLCCFNSSHIRFPGLFFAYIESLLKGDPKYLAEFASVFSNVPFCPRDRVRVGTDRKWWGWDTARICEDCYLTFAKDTALEPQFYNRGVFDAEWHPCDLYSPRMRTLYTEACTTGDLLSFLTFSKQRQVIYRQTKFAAQQMLDQQKLRAMQARMAGIQGSFYKNLGWSQDAVMGHSYTVGNAAVGYGHANEWVAQGYAYDQKASALAGSVGGEVGLMMELDRRWAEVA